MTHKPRDRELLVDVDPATFHGARDETAREAVPEEQQKEERGRWYCSASRVEFESAAAYREHCQTPWYAYNLRLQMRGQPPVSEDEFLYRCAEGLDDAVSSGESDDEDSDDEQPTATGPRTTVQLPTGAAVEFWRTTIPAEMPPLEYARRVCDPRSTPPTWCVVLLKGGHFAAAILRARRDHDERRGESPLVVLHHKTFHRYVTRRKQGGRQSTADAGKSIKSAGSSIRRYNEQALTQEVRGLLNGWPLATCDLVLFSSPGPANRAVLFGGADAPLKKDDARVRKVPFPTRRPTLEEAQRTAVELATATFIEPSQQAPATAAAVERAPRSGTPPRGPGQRKRTPPRRGTPPKAREKHGKLLADDPDLALAVPEVGAGGGEEAVDLEQIATRASRPRRRAAPAAAPEVDADDSSRLHHAVAAGDVALVASLLEDGADPTVKSSVYRHQVPFAVARSPAMRSVFTRFRVQDPARWDWKKAKVPDPEVERRMREEAAKQRAMAAERSRELEELQARAGQRRATARADLFRARTVEELEGALSEAAEAGVAAGDTAVVDAEARLEEMLCPPRAAASGSAETEVSWRELAAAAAERRLGVLRRTDQPCGRAAATAAAAAAITAAAASACRSRACSPAVSCAAAAGLSVVAAMCFRPTPRAPAAGADGIAVREGRVLVQLDDGDPKELRAANLLPAEERRGQELVPGLAVVVGGLRAASSMNGQRGTVVGVSATAATQWRQRRKKIEAEQAAVAAADAAVSAPQLQAALQQAAAAGMERGDPRLASAVQRLAELHSAPQQRQPVHADPVDEATDRRRRAAAAAEARMRGVAPAPTQTPEQQLEEMGFEESAVRSALTAAAGDMPTAIAILTA